MVRSLDKLLYNTVPDIASLISRALAQPDEISPCIEYGRGGFSVCSETPVLKTKTVILLYMICQLSDRLFRRFCLLQKKHTTGELESMTDKNNLIKNFIYPQRGSTGKNILFAVTATAALLAPDMIMNYAANTHIVQEPLFILYLWGFMLLLSFCQNKFTYGVIGLFALMQTVQLNFTAYFGHPITAGEIMNIINEKRDIFDTAYLRQTWFVMPMIILFYGIIVFIFYTGSRESVKIRWMFLVVLYLMAHKPYRAWSETKGIWYFQPGPTRPTLKNSINTFSYFFFQYLWKDNRTSEVAYKPYNLQEHPSPTENILLIFGESLYSAHMPMFGYERNTFPRLGKRLSQAPQAAIASAVSPGISTATSTALFFNSVREPGNIKEINDQTANLFRVAKQNGFETYYYSNQESRLIMNIGEKYIDHIANNDSEPVLFAKRHDEGLVDLLQKIDFRTGKKFVVLHMRSPHLPYEKHYKNRKGEFEKFVPAETSKNRLQYTINTYDNALLYTDFVTDEMIETFNQANAGRKATVFLTADHGQLFNFNGMWGHNNLVAEQGKVPAVILGYNAEKLPPSISAYQFGKKILQALGSRLINANETGNIFYLHGNNIYYPYDYLEYQISKDGKIIEKDVKNTNEINQSGF